MDQYLTRRKENVKKSETGDYLVIACNAVLILLNHVRYN